MHTNFLTIMTKSLFYYYEKVFIPYKYMDNWEKFNETSLLEKEDFYNHLNMEDITNADYTHTKRVLRF